MRKASVFTNAYYIFRDVWGENTNFVDEGNETDRQK